MQGSLGLKVVLLATTLMLLVYSVQSLAGAPPNDRRCAGNADRLHLYQRFVDYRKAINRARVPDDLAIFFSPQFINYYQRQWRQAQSDDAKNRALNQYWDNLNSAADIVSVYNRRVNCKKDNAILSLIASLRSDLPEIGGTIGMWRIQIEYTYGPDRWLIDNFEFNKLKTAPKQLRLLDNFVVIP